MKRSFVCFNDVLFILLKPVFGWAFTDQYTVLALSHVSLWRTVTFSCVLALSTNTSNSFLQSPHHTGSQKCHCRA